MRDWWRWSVTRELSRLRSDGRAALLWSLRITVAAVASYVAGTLFFPGTQPLLAPLTAMLVVQVTPVSLLASGIDRVVAVVTGVSLAVAFATVVPLQWWSLGAPCRRTENSRYRRSVPRPAPQSNSPAGISRRR